MESNLFAKTPPVRLFFLAAIPGAISMLASSLYGLLDGIFVGQFLGETAFAGLNLAFPFVIINFSLADLIGVGAAVPIAISLGRKQQDEADNIFTCACIMIVGTGAVIGAALYAAAPFLIGMMGAEGELARMAVEYMRVYALCSPVTTIVFAMDNFLRISGKIRGSMALNIFMSALSMLLEFLFLYVFRFGVWGAALATCASMFVCALAAFFVFARGKLALHFIRPRFRLQMIRQIIACGTPNFLSNIAGRITSILMNMVLLRLGGERAVSIYGVRMYVDGVVQPILYGVCDSLQPAVGYNWGAGRRDRVRAIERCCFTAGAAISLLSAVVIFLFPRQITGLFVQDMDAAFLSTAVLALQLFSATYLTKWFGFAAQGYMLAVEKSVYATLISVCTALAFPLLFIGVFWALGLTGIWLNFAATSALAAVLAGVLLLRFRKEMRRLDQAESARVTG